MAGGEAKVVRARPDTGAVSAYILGMVRAAVFYVQHAANFGAVVIGLLKALVWPAFPVYHLLG